jgi:integrase
VPLPQPIGSDAFWEAYRAALKGEIATGEIAIGAKLRSGAGSVSAALAAYYASPWWAALSDGTRTLRRPLLEHRIREPYGQWPLKQMTTNFIQALLEGMPPHSARNLKKALGGFLKHAKHDVMRDIVLPPAKSTRHASWPLAVQAQWEATHAIGLNPRLCFAIAKYTGLGCSEICRLGPQHIDGDMIRIARKKTDVPVPIPLHPELRAIIDATPLTGLQTFLITKRGKPYQPRDLSGEFRLWSDRAGVDRKYTLHGLRHTMGKAIVDSGGKNRTKLLRYSATPACARHCTTAKISIVSRRRATLWRVCAATRRKIILATRMCQNQTQI